MFIDKNRITMIVSVVVAMSSCSVQALLPPSAATSSKQSITANIADSRVLYGMATLNTHTDAQALSINSGVMLYPSIHASSASISAYSPNDMNAVANFNVASSTSAAALAYGPLLSRSVASSQSSVFAVVEPASQGSAIVNIDWEFSALTLQTEALSTFAYISDTLNITQAVGTEVQATELGFYAFLENGRQTRGFLGTADVTQTLASWFDDNITQDGYQLTLDADAEPINIDLDLIAEPYLVLRIDHEHTEVSYEAPLAAVHQTDEQVGRVALRNDPVQLHWDADTLLLSFDDLPINTLSNSRHQQYQNEPLSGGYLEIDPLQLLAHVDGRDYFAGEEFRLVDAFGEVLYRASLPSVVFDESLFADQGFNMFAPILNILEADPDASNWLQDNYLDNVHIASLLLPELFIGFTPVKNADAAWSQSFSAPVSAVVSFSGVPSPDSQSAAVVEPKYLLLLSLGLLSLLLNHQNRGMYQNQSIFLVCLVKRFIKKGHIF